jgi:polysaccharide export outer membrane protein
MNWRQAGPIPWEAFGHGEYIGPARIAHVPEYRLRVDDVIDFVFRLTREVSTEPYRLEVGDRIEVQSLTSPEQNKEVEIQSDGTVSLGVLGQVSVAGRTIAELREYLNEAYSEYLRNPGITVTPLDTNTKLDELIATVDNRYGRGGQARPARVTPEGTVQLPAIGSVPAQGLTLDELKREVDAHYNQIVDGLEVTPILQERAPRYVYVVGEVENPGRFTLEGPTTVMQSIALAGSWNVGADLRHVIVFRRDHTWNLMATRLDIRGALYGRKPCPADEIWLRDSDIVVIPKNPILEIDDAIDLLFTRGVYSVFPVRWTYQLRGFSSL